MVGRLEERACRGGVGEAAADEHGREHPADPELALEREDLGGVGRRELEDAPGRVCVRRMRRRA
jgi:hypothetical protein